MYVDPLTGVCVQEDQSNQHHTSQYLQPLPGFNQLTDRVSCAPLDHYNIPVDQLTPTSPPIDNLGPYYVHIDYNLDSTAQDLDFVSAFVDTPAPDSPSCDGPVFRFAPEDIERFHHHHQQQQSSYDDGGLMLPEPFLDDAYQYHNQAENLTPSEEETKCSTYDKTLNGQQQQQQQQQMQCRWLDCHLMFSDRRTLVGHIEKTHVKCGKAEEYSCLWMGCPRSKRPFNARYKLLIHMRVHSGDKPNKCPFSGCDKAFSRLENLKIHQRSHTGERPYGCQYAGCRKAFSNSSDRAKHQRTHFDTKPYACQLPGCNKRYTDPSSLRKHAKLHSARGEPGRPEPDADADVARQHNALDALDAFDSLDMDAVSSCLFSIEQEQDEYVPFESVRHLLDEHIGFLDGALDYEEAVL